MVILGGAMKRTFILVLVCLFSYSNADAFVNLFGKKRTQLMEAQYQENNKALAQLTQTVGAMSNDLALVKELSLSIDSTIGLDSNIDTKLNSVASGMAELRFQLGAIDKSLSQQLSAGGDLQSTVNDPIIFIIAGIVFVVLIVSNVVTVIMLTKEKASVSDYKRSYFDMKNQYAELGSIFREKIKNGD